MHPSQFPVRAEPKADPERFAQTSRADQAAERNDEFLHALRRLDGGRRIRRNIRLAAFLCDIVAIVLALAIGSTLRFGNPFAVHMLNLLGFIVPVYSAVAWNLRSYDLMAIRHAGTGATRALASFALTLGIVGLAAFFLEVSDDLSRAVLALGSFAALLLLVAGRLVVAAAGRRIDARSMLSEVVIRDGIDFAVPQDAVVIDTDEHDLLLQLDNPYLMSRLGHYLSFADRVVVACPPNRRHLWSIALKGADIDGEVIAPELDALGAIGLRTFEHRSTLIVSKSPLGVYDRVLKRLFDLTLTLLVMPVLLPIMAVVAIAVKLDSPGPVLFRQERLGLGNRLFPMFKFRSMYAEESDTLGATSTGRSDNRITRVGRFIRATSIDELPQVFNVLRGEMSIVGPRPHPILCKAEERLFWDIDVAYWHRHAIKPGITGLAQVRGFRGATENTAQFTSRLQSDLEYLQNWSLWRDVRIIIATFRVLVHRNAF